uniref:hypothetical protein n=1 Tax=Elioraea sp. TaxID=2185103 RepID=UPI00307FA8A4
RAAADRRKPRSTEDIPAPVAEALCRATRAAGLRDAVDLHALGAQMQAAAREVRAAFNTHVADLGPVDAGPDA